MTQWEVPRGLDRGSMTKRRPDLYGPLLKSYEPVRWYDDEGYPTAWAEAQRAKHRKDISTSR